MNRSLTFAVWLSLVAYGMANRYAPEGESRERQEAQMRAILIERGVLRAEDAE